MNVKTKIPVVFALSLAFTGCNEDGTFFPDASDDTSGGGGGGGGGTADTGGGGGTTGDGGDGTGGTTDAGGGGGTTDGGSTTTDGGGGTTDGGGTTTDGGGGTAELTAEQRAIVADFCEVYQRCEPEGFGEYFGSIEACVDEFASYFADYGDYGADCLDTYLAFIECAAAQPTCEESYYAYQNACRELYAAIDDACGFSGGDYTDPADAGFPPPMPDAG